MASPTVMSTALGEDARPNPFSDAQLAGRYEDWYTGPGRHADQLERRLLAKLLSGFPRAQSIVEVGCGKGHFCRWFHALGCAVVGLDSSPVMLAEARLRNGVRYIEGDAHQLPFADQTFDVAALITMLEFVADPPRVLREAARVSRQGLLLGVLNRRSLLAWHYRHSGKPLWREARFFTVGELKRLILDASGERLVSVRWSTTLWPLTLVGDLPLPWGGFIGLAASLRPDES
jgi:SAM-dependent methyltransferase